MVFALNLDIKGCHKPLHRVAVCILCMFPCSHRFHQHLDLLLPPYEIQLQKVQYNLKTSYDEWDVNVDRILFRGITIDFE